MKCISEATRVLKPGAIVHIATDSANYAEHCIEAIRYHSHYDLSKQYLERPMTKFARKAIAKGDAIADIVVVHTSDAIA